MTIVVENSAGEIERLTTGNPVARPEIEADNARGAENKGEKQPPAAAKAPETAASTENDDVEGDDGLTPRQKREFSKSMLAAVGKKHRMMKEAEEFAADQYNNRRLAEQRAQALEQELAQIKGKQPAPKAVAEEPKRANFETDDAYQNAMIDWRVEQKLQQKQREAAEAAEQERIQKIVQTATERLKQAAEIVPDFTEVTEAAEMNVPGHIAAYMQRSPLFAELGYHFAKHPEVLKELAKLPPDEALVEIGALKSTLKPVSETHKAKADKGDEKVTDGTTPSTSNGQSKAAPSPETGTAPSKHRAPVITPLNAGSTAQVEKPPEEMNTREVIDDWQKRRKANLGLRRRH